jgi:hypothetical protein
MRDDEQTALEAQLRELEEFVAGRITEQDFRTANVARMNS